jgi:hypothetical protein
MRWPALTETSSAERLKRGSIEVTPNKVSLHLRKKIENKRERWRDRQTETEGEREIDRERQTERDREIERQRGNILPEHARVWCQVDSPQGIFLSRKRDLHLIPCEHQLKRFCLSPINCHRLNDPLEWRLRKHRRVMSIL